MNKQEITALVKKLQGIKILVMGNHDIRINKHAGWWREVGFKEVYRYPIIYKDFYILSHEPVYLNESCPYANIHGHIHSKSYDLKNYVNVCVEKINYKPIFFD